MQEDEEYGNLVWDNHFGNNYDILQKQKFLFQISGIVNPLLHCRVLAWALWHRYDTPSRFFKKIRRL